ncbi:protein SIEVE ELEMENT OCCLUSION B [Cucumis sativus]|uniref:Protein SIEVE ELEMENT OCCLUSION B-like n=1 Tax=Cucumis sativus TaxID=3659 RepID=A0A0A0LNQ7_CUCSA|nr:protein SIEVE ELEMENT OCCLUSION B [Cucumis sativus]
MSLPLPNNPLAPSVLPKLSATKDDQSLRHYSDEIVTSHIYTKHREDNRIKIDVDNYIALVESIITTADRITETVAQGTEGRLIFSDEFLNVNAVDPPLCTLHHVSSQLSCKAPGIETAHETTLEILDILVSYPWEAKAVLTLTAFATEYGDIWHLNHYSLLDPLAKSLAMIKRVPLLKKQLDSIKYRQLLLTPNSLIYSCLKAMKYISILKNFSKYDIKELSELSSVLRQIPLVAYWIIHIIVASRIEISSYLNETEGQSQKYMNELSEKINSILYTLENHLKIIKEQQDEIDLYRWLVDHIDNFPTEITAVVPKLIEGKFDAKPFIDGSTKLQVSVEDGLRDKNVILVISGLDISEDDIRALHSIYNEVKREDKYKIVWIPVITVETEDEEEEARKKYEYASSLMKWYIVPYTRKIAGWRYLEENWQLRQDPLIVVMNSKSRVEFNNAIHLIRVWGIDAIPFTNGRTNALLAKNWPESTLFKFIDQPRLMNWVNQERNIIFYGGKEPKWIQQFEDRIVEIKNDPYLKEKGNTFEIIRVGQNIKGDSNDFTLTPQFWLTQWGYFVIKSQLKGSSATETTEDILRLISYENENGWAIVAVGSTPLLVGRGNLIMGVLQDFNKWKRNMNIKAFPDAFRDYFNELNLNFHICERMTLPGFSGWIPMIVNCPECPRFMETGISFKCNHGRYELS